MRLLHVIANADPKGGGPIEWVRQASRELVSRGMVSDLAAFNSADSGLDHVPGTTFYALGQGKGQYRYLSGLGNRLTEIAKTYDAVFVHGIWQYDLLAARRACQSAGVPYFAVPHGMLDPWFKRTFPLKHAKKCLYWPLLHRALRQANAVVFTCEEEMLLARQSFSPYQVNERVSPLGIVDPILDGQLSRDQLLERLPQLDHAPFLLFLSRIHRKKGCDLLIEAFVRLADRQPDLHLVMAGPDSESWQQDLEKRVRDAELSHRVHWPGMVANELKSALLAHCDAFVLPSHQETFPISVVEATAYGKAVLTTRNVNTWREVVNSGAGLVEEDTLEGTVRVLEHWFAMTDGQRREMSEAARMCFQRFFEVGSAVDSMLRIVTAPLSEGKIER